MNNPSSNPYGDLNPNLFHSGPSGVIVRGASIIMDLETNKGEYELKEKSSVERNNLVGLWVNAPKTDPQKVSDTKTVVNRAVFDSCYLTIQVGQNQVQERIPLSRIEAANANGMPFRVNIGAKVNLSESKLYVGNSDQIAANEVIEITADYVISHNRK